MKEWQGSAAICINDDNEILMVRGIKSEAWAVPSGGIERGETPEMCCVREVKEETGYTVKVKRLIHVKEIEIQGIAVTSYYFLVEKIGESDGIDDPDQLIEEFAWKSLNELDEIVHVYPEDKELIEGVINSQVKGKSGT
ncbi:NUDIX hydrolase [Ornithinibacillus californiensis]|uniref:NUDIX hydrolase n=1 Tax=Ornithinibacillus californiensis TaxID=161536 RepID=UPI00064DB742|nr:NUDIX hydrolase [Ornithinibacillus californiensis]